MAIQKLVRCGGSDRTRGQNDKIATVKRTTDRKINVRTEKQKECVLFYFLYLNRYRRKINAFRSREKAEKGIINFGFGGYIMYDTKERVIRAKERADRLIRKREKRIIGGMSTLCLMLSCCLAGIIGKLSEGRGGAVVQGMNGATLLSESTGGYVLVAVISFLVAVVFTLLCVRLHERNGRLTKEKKEGTR